MVRILLLGVIAVASVEAGNFRMKTHYSSTCDCIPVMDEVCGTDGLTYMNMCYLHCAALFNKGLMIHYSGPCRSIYDRCGCPLIWFPVCGSDGLTYANMCELLCTSFFSPIPLFPAQLGPCPPIPQVNLTTTEAPGNVTQPTPTKPASNATETTTIAPKFGYHLDEELHNDSTCSDYKTCDRMRCMWEPVRRQCASNGRTYRNVCRFCCAKLRQPHLKIVFEGRCRGKKSKKSKSHNRRSGEDSDPHSYQDREDYLFEEI